ncbi:MAG: hypothetical protein K9G67_08080 [Bacteroidales bacterium]|nr:hypothetical protein [Bacteroidales bacterium]MCF8345277.1 hypothetical protein [Bacteroidales bacterium]MCF8349778.1 hypothetical protein [Bacteroidales bacterium]MCF8376297.1 hypothetical protein [Bacteroidales bacterium]MCF8400991.1 hypothetical protein [Bacteroidales bacterium]
MNKFLKVFIGGLALMLFLSTTCEEEDSECEKRGLDSPVTVDYYAFGKVIIAKTDGTDITSMFAGKKFVVRFNKEYCNGKNGSTFEYYFTMLASGDLDRDGSAVVEFEMDNKDDIVEMSSFVYITDETIGVPTNNSTFASRSVWGDGDINAKMTLSFQAAENNEVYWEGGSCNWEMVEF